MVPLLLVVLANAGFYISIASVIASALGGVSPSPHHRPAFAEINRIEGVKTMVPASKIAIALAIVLGLGLGTAASAASKNAVHRRVVPPAAYNSFGYARSAGQIHEPMNMYIQDQDWRESVGLPYGG